jgi:inner membrane protein
MKNFLANSAWAKVLALAFLTLLATWPLSQIGGLIHERGASREHAAQALAAAHAGPQVVSGPFLVVPYVEKWTEEQLDEFNRPKGRVARSKSLTHYVFPEKSDLQGRMTAQQRYRGIFTVQFYDLKGAWIGRFPAFDPASLPRTEKNSTVESQPPVLALALSDLRGLQGAPALQLAGSEARWQPRVPGVAQESWLAKGIHAPLPAEALKAWNEGSIVDYRLDLTLVGQEKLAIVPLADDNRAKLVSDWPHPSFGGEFLALRRQVSEAGFEAEWAVSSLVSAARSQLVQSATHGAPRGPQAEAVDSFDVSLVEPLNVYALSHRAIKYGLLFVALVLMAAFMFELFKGLRLHPVQYGLVGLSITLFFLLLLALSEKLAFGLAYGLAALASVTLLTVYFGAVLDGWWRGLGLGGYVAVLYAALYGLLSSEDNALLLGALLLFGLLALLMIGTRRVNWYALVPAAAPSA